MRTALNWLAQTVPSEIAGLPTWVLNGLSIGGLVMFILVGLATSRLWTKSQVDNLIARYEKHLERTVNLYQGRVDDAIRREGEWREIAQKYQQVAETLAEAIEPMQEQSATTLAIVQEMQGIKRLPPRGRGRAS